MMDKDHSPQHDHLQKKHALEEREVNEVREFLKQHGKLIGAGVLAAVVAVFAAKLYEQNKASRLVKAEQMMMSAQSPQDLESVVNQYGSTPSAPTALLDLAKILFNNGNATEARTQYERFLKQYKNHEMRPVAELGLVYCSEADGDFNGAAAQFAAFAKNHAGSYLQPQAILGVARCMEQAGRIDEARIVLEDFLAENAGTASAGAAESALKTLNETSRKK
ncbi:MAG: tetratricopeptide repeat protein [Verrucomicrobia bacterium]|nr:tetratricopeptide repeat protein [Verrucomicrobiota bacterium]